MKDGIEGILVAHLKWEVIEDIIKEVNVMGHESNRQNANNYVVLADRQGEILYSSQSANLKDISSLHRRGTPCCCPRTYIERERMFLLYFLHRNMRIEVQIFHGD